MKIAIIGSGPLAMEAAFHFNKLGARAQLYTKNEKLGGSIKKLIAPLGHLDMDGSWLEITSKEGREVTRLSDKVDFNITPSIKIRCII